MSSSKGAYTTGCSAQRTMHLVKLSAVPYVRISESEMRSEDDINRKKKSTTRCFPCSSIFFFDIFSFFFLSSFSQSPTLSLFPGAVVCLYHFVRYFVHPSFGGSRLKNQTAVRLLEPPAAVGSLGSFWVDKPRVGAFRFAVGKRSLTQNGSRPAALFPPERLAAVWQRRNGLFGDCGSLLWLSFRRWYFCHDATGNTTGS